MRNRISIVPRAIRRAQIQAELNAHEASMQEYDKQVASGWPGCGRVSALARDHGQDASRRGSARRAATKSTAAGDCSKRRQTLQAITAAHNALEAKANEAGTTGSHRLPIARLSLRIIKDKAAQRQILSIYDDRIQTEQQLATVYGKWAAQVLLQHRIVLHLILQSLALIAFIGICMVLCDALVRRLMDNPCA